MKKSRSEEIETIWASLPPSVATASFTASIRPPPPAVTGPRPTGGARIELRGELGRGGMGIVHLGYQLSLRREVAVKIVPRSIASRDEQAGVREALAAGYLEHPNIVPVYTVDRDEDGTPLIVMKRIEGVAWSECIAHPEVAPRMRADDPMDWHLDVFAAVCRAVQFAHDKGILHRDIKPDNVLIGRHGDVYLVDWGLAVALDPALRGRVPLASEVRRISGTPGYMAPEMLAAGEAALSPATDVYLLGATLHEVVTKQPRHTGDDLAAVLEATYLSTPHDHGPEVPTELAAICNRATHRHPSERFATVGELARSVRDFQRKRPALRFLDEAQVLLERLKGPMMVSERGDDQIAANYEIFGQCRSAIGEALRVWPDHARGLAMRDEALRHMAELELTRGNLNDAEDLIGRMRRRDERLARDLDSHRRDAASREREYDRLKELERDLDADRDGRTKAVLVFVFGLVVFIHNVNYGPTLSAGQPKSLSFLVGPLLLLLTLVALGFAWRGGTFRNQASRQVLYVLLALAVTILGVRLVGAVHEIPPDQTHTYLGGIYAFGAAQVASMFDRRIYASAAILTVGAVASLLIPTLTFEIVGTSVLFATALMAGIWWGRAKPIES